MRRENKSRSYMTDWDGLLCVKKFLSLMV
ncbi:DUF4113 domain-containing protein [Nitrosomonas sp. Nm166]